MHKFRAWFVKRPMAPLVFVGVSVPLLFSLVYFNNGLSTFGIAAYFFSISVMSIVGLTGNFFFSEVIYPKKTGALLSIFAGCYSLYFYFEGLRDLDFRQVDLVLTLAPFGMAAVGICSLVTRRITNKSLRVIYALANLQVVIFSFWVFYVTYLFPLPGPKITEGRLRRREKVFTANLFASSSDWKLTGGQD